MWFKLANYDKISPRHNIHVYSISIGALICARKVWLSVSAMFQLLRQFLGSEATIQVRCIRCLSDSLIPLPFIYHKIYYKCYNPLPFSSLISVFPHLPFPFKFPFLFLFLPFPFHLPSLFFLSLSFSFPFLPFLFPFP